MGKIEFMTQTTEKTQKHPSLVKLGENVKRLRIAAALSQEELAFAAEIDRTFLSAIERGVANPTVNTLASLIKVMNASFEEIVEGVETYPPNMFGLRRKNAAKPPKPTTNRRLR